MELNCTADLHKLHTLKADDWIEFTTTNSTHCLTTVEPTTVEPTTEDAGASAGGQPAGVLTERLEPKEPSSGLDAIVALSTPST